MSKLITIAGVDQEKKNRLAAYISKRWNVEQHPSVDLESFKHVPKNVNIVIAKSPLDYLVEFLCSEVSKAIPDEQSIVAMMGEVVRCFTHQTHQIVLPHTDINSPSYYTDWVKDGILERVARGAIPSALHYKFIFLTSLNPDKQLAILEQAFSDLIIINNDLKLL